MIKSYFRIAIRAFTRHRFFSFLNLSGLSVGMAVAMLIGLWIWDETSYNQHHPNYDRIVRLMQLQTSNGAVREQTSVPIPLATELRTNYAGDFDQVAMSSYNFGHTLVAEEQKLTQKGSFVEPNFPDILGLQMLKGTRAGLQEPSSVLLSASLSRALFGDTDPINRMVRIDQDLLVKVTGVYADLPANSEFAEARFFAPWDLFLVAYPWLKNAQDQWGNNACQIFAQLNPKADWKTVSERIKNLRAEKSPEIAALKPVLFLHPMSRWHLYSEWKNGRNVGGRIELVWLFGLIGAFVLLLACINFMNLSTARSSLRTREVGVRKTLGSLRRQLIGQFLTETLLMALLSLGGAFLLVQLALPSFNEVAQKQLTISWNQPVFWLLCLGFTLLTGLVAGSYPAFYLSSFHPIQVLKGTLRSGRYASAPRQVLVVLQFSVSVTLVIGVLVVFNQIRFAKNRPSGYDRTGLLSVSVTVPDIHNHYQAVRHDLIKTGAVINMAESLSPTTEVWASHSDFDWKGKDPNKVAELVTFAVSPEYGSTVGWEFREGRDFSRALSSDSTACVLNETAARLMHFQSAVGETIRWQGNPLRVIGVIRDMVMTSPYQPVKPTLFFLMPYPGGTINIRLHPQVGTQEALAQIRKVFQQYSPTAPFDYHFADEEYARKFASEERIGQLAAGFAFLAIFVSCLGLLGLVSFVAEQRTREIGIRKVLGATLYQVWQLLTVDFLKLILVSLLISVPVAGYLMSRWLLQFEYRTELSWWIFATAGLGVLLISLLTVSFQAIKAALANPVKSLRTE